MRTISSLLAVAGFSTGLIVACGGGLGTPADSLLGSDPLPNSGDPAHSSTDPSGSSTDPNGTGGCVCPVGTWACGGAIDSTVQVSLKNGVCTIDQVVTLDCSGHFTAKGQTGSVKVQGSDLYACLGNTCATCKPKTTTIDPDASVIPDTGVKDTGVLDAPKDVAKEAAAVCLPSCSFDSDCQSTCPAAPNGLFNCCDQNTLACTIASTCTGP